MTDNYYKKLKKIELRIRIIFKYLENNTYIIIKKIRKHN